MAEYDIFISYKHTDENGETTEDYAIAEKLYQALTDAGLQVFFSSAAIFQSGIGDYKKAIDNALDSAKALVVLATQSEYLMSGWIEYEYETFYEDILSGRKTNATLVSYTNGQVSRQLPRTLSRLQNYIIEQMPIEKLVEYLLNSFDAVGAEIPSAQKATKQAKTTNVDNAASAPLLKRGKSSYVSDYANELKRLELQSQRSAGSDTVVLNALFDKKPWAPDEKLFVLDVGSAYGFVADKAFSGIDQVEKVLCFDNNERVINRAEVIFAENSKLIFTTLDVESESFEDDLRAVMAQHDIPKFHIVYSALTLLHLANPDKALRRLRSIMDDGDYIVLRGSDDGSKMCYPNSELLDEIMQRSLNKENKGGSDRANGRKLFAQLTNSGFQEVEILSNMIDLSHLAYDDRESLFQVAFSFRLNYCRRMCEENPDDKEARENLAWMEDALTRFENQFFQRDFWYCSYDYMALAKK